MKEYFWRRSMSEKEFIGPFTGLKHCDEVERGPCFINTPEGGIKEMHKFDKVELDKWDRLFSVKTDRRIVGRKIRSRQKIQKRYVGIMKDLFKKINDAQSKTQNLAD